MTAAVGELLARATATLRDGGSPTPRLDSEVLLAHAIGCDRSWLLAHPEAEVASDGFESLLDRRLEGEPIAYLRGFKEWRSLRIRTDARALIPRPETELLYELAVDEIRARIGRDDPSIVAWEPATGSGAVTLALALRFRDALALGRLRLIASDVSADALELAAENLESHGVRALVDLACVDLLEPAGAGLPRPDVVVANLPYVPSLEVESGEGSLAFEPRLALDGGPDGLGVVRRLLASVKGRVAPGASVLLEIGSDQADAVRAMAPPEASVQARRDLAGFERVVELRLADVSP